VRYNNSSIECFDQKPHKVEVQETIQFIVCRHAQTFLQKKDNNTEKRCKANVESYLVRLGSCMILCYVLNYCAKFLTPGCWLDTEKEQHVQVRVLVKMIEQKA
jgi:hypothetical protein